MRVLLLLQHAGQVGRLDALIDELARLGHEVIVMLEQHKRAHLKDRNGLLTALTRAHTHVRHAPLPESAAAAPGARPGTLLTGRLGRHLPSPFRSDVRPALVSELRSLRTDVVVSCPPPDPRTPRAALEHAARTLGVPTVAMLDTWEPPVGRLVRGHPSALCVWNRAQAAAAREQRGGDGRTVVLAGAPGFDRLLGFAAVVDRATFCRSQGLDPTQGFRLLVVGAELAGGGPGWVFEQARALRRTGCQDQLLVIGHDTEMPKDLLSSPNPPSDLDDCLVWSALCLGQPRVARERYRHALHHGVGVLSAHSTPVLDAALLGMPAHLLRAPEGSLAGATLEAASGGTVRAFTSDRLLPDCEGDPRRLHDLVRPLGATDPVAPRLAAELIALARPRGTHDAGSGAADDPGASNAKRDAPGAHPSQREAAYAPTPQPLRPFRTRIDSELELLRFKLAKATRGDGPILAGPFVSEVGFELMYWIPFLRWAQHEMPGLRDRLIVVSRGGTSSWTRDFAAGYADVYAVCEPDEILQRRTSQKQRVPSELDLELLDRVREHLGLGGASALHPSLFFEFYYRVLKSDQRSFPRCVLSDADGTDGLAARYLPIEAPERDELDALLPEHFVAVRFYTRPSLPDSPENRRFIARTLKHLVARSPVVLLNNGMELDEHVDFGAGHGSVTTIEHLMQPTDNLDVQTAVLARAQAFVGTYGGLSYLAPHLGVPALTFSSEPQHAHPFHLELAQSIFAAPGFGDIVSLRTSDIDLIRLITPSFETHG